MAQDEGSHPYFHLLRIQDLLLARETGSIERTRTLTVIVLFVFLICDPLRENRPLSIFNQNAVEACKVS